MPANAPLHKARQKRRDEFYTALAVIERGLIHYSDHFKGKVVYCNCDDPEYSNFWRYFEMHFARLGLKKLVATHYKPTTLFENEPAYKLELVSSKRKPKKILLAGDGDFRSEECKKIIKEADIVVTNPPFSLFREYLTQLVEENQKFIIMGGGERDHHQGAVSPVQRRQGVDRRACWPGSCVSCAERLRVSVQPDVHR